MHGFKGLTTVVMGLTLMMLVACGGPVQTNGSSSSSSAGGSGGEVALGGMGGSGATGATGGQGGGVAGMGGMGGAPSVPCNVVEDCTKSNPKSCRQTYCFNGVCTEVNAPSGTICENVPNDVLVCDVAGDCGHWIPFGGKECIIPSPITPVCPSCDDGDPATQDTCVADGQGGKCTNMVLPDGWYCGLYYGVLNGVCCPVPNSFGG